MSLPESLRRGLIVKKQTLYPNRMSWFTRVTVWLWDEPSALSVRNIARTLNDSPVVSAPFCCAHVGVRVRICAVSVLPW